MSTALLIPKTEVIGTADLLPVATTIMKLLGISDGHDISLILGYPLETNNRWAIVQWVYGYLEEHSEGVNFREHIFPAFAAHLRQQRSSLVDSVREYC